MIGEGARTEGAAGEQWQKVGVDEIRGPTGPMKMAQIYVPNQGFGQNLYGPEWLIDRVLADHNATAALAEANAELEEAHAAGYREADFADRLVAEVDALKAALAEAEKALRAGLDLVYNPPAGYWMKASSEWMATARDALARIAAAKAAEGTEG